METLRRSCLVLLVIFGSFTRAEVFFFQQAKYLLDETPGADNVNSVLVTISRTGSAVETRTETSTTISTDCPNKLTATASSTDYTLGQTTVTFRANTLSATVSITIKDDNEDELREFFCLTITTNPGTQYTTRIYIPGNDFCVNLDSKEVSTASADDIADDTSVIYVSPWCVGDGDDSEFIDVEIQPEPDGDDDDIFIWLTDVANQLDSGVNYYGIFFDDTMAATHDTSGTSANGDSIVVKNAVDGTGFVGSLNDVSMSGISDVLTRDDERFKLQYSASSGLIELTDSSGDKYGVTDDTTPVDVRHIFVSTGSFSYASWRICGLSPRKIPGIAAYSPGYLAGYAPSKAIDNYKGENAQLGGCFVSDSGTPLIQIDLGREYDVKLVLIWPMRTRPGISDRDWLDNARVYVGSCPATDITSNNACSSNIGNVDDGVIEVRCSGTNYGRYVYIYQDTSAAQRISLCEVEVYGDEVPVSDEAIVEFSLPTFHTADDESAESVSVTATRTGSSALTCTTADFYTDTFTIPGGYTDDFTPVLSNNPTTLQWTASDISGTSKTVTISVADDTRCEPTETFNVYLTNVVGGVLGSQSCSTVSIIDDDSVTYALSSSSFSVGEGNSVSIGVTRLGNGNMQDGSAGLTFTDVTAQSGDYTSASGTVVFTSSSSSPQYYTVSTVDDQAYEGDETFTVDVGSLEPSTCSTLVSPLTATVTVTDNDSLFSWDTSDDIIRIPEGTSATTITITRKGLIQSKTINIIVNDEVGAEASSDFTLSDDRVTFSVDDASESITINVEDDSVVEDDELFTLTLEDPNYTTGHRNLGKPYRLTVIIEDDDGIYTWKQEQYSTSESVGTLQVCLLRTGDISTSTNVQISSSTANGVDFTPLTQIAFTAGSSEACGNVAIGADSIVENTESFTLTIVPGQQGVEIGATNTATVSITDDDSTITWESPIYSFDETSTSNFVTILKTGSGTATVTIIAQAETARQNVDFVPVSTSVLISDNSVRIPVNIIDDDDEEPSETFTLTLSGAGITSSLTRVTIVDNDVEPTKSPPAMSEGLGGGAIAAIITAGVIAVLIIVGAIAAVCWFAHRTTSAASAPSADPPVSYLPTNYSVNPLVGLDSYGNGYRNPEFTGFNQGYNQTWFGLQ